MFRVLPLDETHTMSVRNTEFYFSSEVSVREVGYHIVPSDRRFIADRHVYILHYVISGKGTFNGQRFAQGDCYVTISGEHEDVIPDPDDPYETVWMIFLGNLVPKLLADSGIELRNHVFSFDGTEECIRLIKRVLFEKKYKDKVEEAFDMHALFFRILSRHAVSKKLAKSDTEEVAVLAAEYIEQNFNRPISIKNVAEYVHFSPNYFCSVFKMKFGISPQEYLLSFRISRAQQLLRNFPELSVSDIAENCGFKDPLYFSRIFKIKTGKTPTGYKKSTDF